MKVHAHPAGGLTVDGRHAFHLKIEKTRSGYNPLARAFDSSSCINIDPPSVSTKTIGTI